MHHGTIAYLYEQRRCERRMAHRFVWRERRTGFDRRGREGALSVAALREHPAALVALLAAVNVLNLLDQTATTRALAAGFSEGNPVMAALIAADPALAAFLKLGAVLAVTLAVWALRRYRLMLQVAVLTFGLFSAVLLWHVVGAALYY